MTFFVPFRFRGPAESGNGGWVSGHLAVLVPTTPQAPAVSVRLRTPPPLEHPMEVRSTPEDGREVFDGDVLVASATAAPEPSRGDLPTAAGFERAASAGTAYEGLHDHPFPTCFSCGTVRGADALGLRPGLLEEGSDLHAAAWVPHDVTPEIVWAALDCPGAWALGVRGRPMVLGTMTARLLSLPEGGQEHVVMAWGRGGQGRTFHCGTALYAGQQLLAYAHATWITIDPAAIRPTRSSS